MIRRRVFCVGEVELDLGKRVVVPPAREKGRGGVEQFWAVQLDAGKKKKETMSVDLQRTILVELT